MTKKSKLATAFVLAVALVAGGGAGYALCHGQAAKLPSVGQTMPDGTRFAGISPDTKKPAPVGMDNVNYREKLAKKFFAKEGYKVVSLTSSTSPYYDYFDYYLLEKIKDDGHLYKGSIHFDRSDHTLMQLDKIKDLGVRASALLNTPSTPAPAVP